MKDFEIVIVGAGPAGLRAAKVLTEEGKKVIVLEKNSVLGQKVCAGGISPKIFERIPLPEDLIERKFNSIIYHSPWQKVKIKSNEILLVTISRENLGKFLAKEAQKAGATIFLNSKVKEIKENRVTLENGKIFSFDYLIGADGANSLVRKYLKLPSKLLLTFQYTLPQYFQNLECFYDPKLFGIGYAWIFPHKNLTKIGCGDILKFQIAKELLSNFHLWLKKLKIDISGAKLESGVINYDYRGYQFGKIFLVGEAAGFLSGFSGGGIYQALISGEEIAKKILNKNYKPKINSILISLKIQEKFFRLLKLNRNFTHLFQEIYLFSLKFLNLLKK